MRAGLARQGTMVAAGNLMAWGGMIEIVGKQLMELGGKILILGAFMICMVMCGNGVLIGR